MEETVVIVVISSRTVRRNSSSGGVVGGGRSVEHLGEKDSSQASALPPRPRCWLTQAQRRIMSEWTSFLS